MTDQRGAYIVLEGPEGSGKTTQMELLASRLRQNGHIVRLFREPDSQTDLTARAIRLLTQDPRYPMNTRTEVLLYNAARSQSLEIIRKARDAGVTCICDRNYMTTLAVQYYGRGDVPDYDTINKIIGFAVGDMEPDYTVILDAPAQELRARAEKRGAGERFDNLGVDFLERVRAGYLWEAKNRGYSVVHAIGNPEEVHEQLWQALVGQKPRVRAAEAEPPITVSQSAEPVETEATTDKPLVKKTKTGVTTITAEGKRFLQDAVTSIDGDVYGFTEKISPITAAAAMARLSRRADDMRITILDEFTGKAGKDEDLLKRVITAYGDDSVQQLVGQHLVVENASNLLTKKLEWGRLAAYLEQSTRYIYFDQKDKNGQYRYYTPKLNAAMSKRYSETLDKIFDLYSEMVRKLTKYVEDKSTEPQEKRDAAWKAACRAQACDAIRNVLPVATKSTVGIFASAQAIESLIMHLQSDELTEAQEVGSAILAEARKIIPSFLERADKPERGGAAIAYRANTFAKVKELSTNKLSGKLSGDLESVRLVDYWPKNELDVLPHVVYEHSTLSLGELENELADWTYDEKVEALTTYFGERLNRRHKPGRALEIPHYSFDLVCDYGIFRDLQRHRMVDSMEWQKLTPRYGYEVPSLVEEAGLSDLYESCFDLSAELYSAMQSAGYELDAQYATLLGHRMRWKVTYNARQAFHLHELRTTPHGHPGYRKLVKEMHEQVASVHPIIASGIKFVNKDEDPELTRLAAERYTQFKLGQLGG